LERESTGKVGDGVVVVKRRMSGMRYDVGLTIIDVELVDVILILIVFELEN